MTPQIRGMEVEQRIEQRHTSSGLVHVHIDPEHHAAQQVAEGWPKHRDGEQDSWNKDILQWKNCF